MNKFKETGSVNDSSRSGRPRVGEETVASVKETIEASLKRSLIKMSITSGGQCEKLMFIQENLDL